MSDDDDELFDFDEGDDLADDTDEFEEEEEHINITCCNRCEHDGSCWIQNSMERPSFGKECDMTSEEQIILAQARTGGCPKFRRIEEI